MKKRKIGIFGGGFNPLHNGHVNSCVQVKDNFNLDHIYVVPVHKPVHKKNIKKILNKDRYLMIESFFSGLNPDITVHDYEFKSKKPNYTIYTIDYFHKTFPEDDLYLIMGIDQFLYLDSWKDIDKILNLCHLIVTSRPPYPWPITKNKLPKIVKEMHENFKNHSIDLKTNKTIHFYKLNDIEISSFQIRNHMTKGASIEKMVPKKINTLIKTNLKNNFEEITHFCSQIITEKQGFNVLGWNFIKTNYFSDFVIISSALNKTHCISLSEHIVDLVKEKYHIKPKHVEGIKGGEWVIVDYGSLIIHLFYDFIRNKYQLEELLEKGNSLNLHTSPSRSKNES